MLPKEKYRIALCSTKPTAKGALIIQAFMRGMEKVGDAYLEITGYNSSNLEKLKRCDILLQICEHNSRGRANNNRENEFRGWCKQKVVDTHCKRRIIVDVGFFKNQTDSPEIALDYAYWSVGYDGIKGEAKFYNENSPQDRWDSFGIELKPWRTEGKHILVLGQNEIGISTQHINYIDWMNETLREIRKYSDRPIVFMAHRHQTVMPSEPCQVIQKNTTIYELCKDAWCCVARTTNGAAGAIISGVPVITQDSRCITYPISDHEISCVSNPSLPDRQQWCNDIGYSQWNIKEIKRGECWTHLRKFIHA
jgi:hypothetical protein